jgi:hypothetical protein
VHGCALHDSVFLTQLFADGRTHVLLFFVGDDKVLQLIAEPLRFVGDLAEPAKNALRDRRL